MEHQNVIEKNDWKEEFVSKLKREQMLTEMQNVTDILTFLNSYFKDLMIEMNEINKDCVSHQAYDRDREFDQKGMFYAVINGYKNAKIEYYEERKNGNSGYNGVTIKTITRDTRNDITTVSQEITWLVAEDGIPYIKELNGNGNLTGDSNKLNVEMLDKIVENYFMNVF